MILNKSNIFIRWYDFIFLTIFRFSKENIWYYGFRRYFSNIKALSGTIFIFLVVISAIFADIISPFNPNEQSLELASKGIMYKTEVIMKATNNTVKILPIKKIIEESDNKLVVVDYLGKEIIYNKSELIRTDNGRYSKIVAYILGTDRYGRDILSRLIFGSRISITVGIISQSISILIGIILGSVAAYYKGLYDKIIMWLVNVVWAFPSILFVIALSLVLGKGYWQAFVAIGLTSWVEIARIIRGQVISAMETEYVEAARASGFGSARIIIKHILPNCTAPLLVAATVGLANSVIFEASLSFLGLGVQPPTASWGQMVFDGYKYLVTGSNYSIVLIPAIAIFLTVYSINLMGDGFRDAFDPKLK